MIDGGPASFALADFVAKNKIGRLRLRYSKVLVQMELLMLEVYIADSDLSKAVYKSKINIYRYSFCKATMSFP